MPVMSMIELWRWRWGLAKEDGTIMASAKVHGTRVETRADTKERAKERTKANIRVQAKAGTKNGAHGNRADGENSHHSIMRRIRIARL